MSEDNIDIGFEILKMLCKREPYLARGILYHKADNSHCLACYLIPPGIDGQKVVPVLLMQGDKLEELILDFSRNLLESKFSNAGPDTENISEKAHWRIVPYSNADLLELEKFRKEIPDYNRGFYKTACLIIDNDCLILSSLNRKSQMYFFLRRRPLEQHMHELQPNSEKASQEYEVRDELKQLKEIILARYVL